MFFLVDCSQSLIFTLDRRDRALTVTCSHFVIVFKCTKGAGVGVLSHLHATLGQDCCLYRSISTIVPKNRGL